MMKTNRRSIVDLYFLLILGAILLISHWAGLDKFLFKFPYITLMVLYFVGKYARDYEIKHYL